MSLERKDIRVKTSPDLHEKLRIFADIAGMEIAEYCESILQKHAEQKVTETIIGAARLARAGLTGK